MVDVYIMVLSVALSLLSAGGALLICHLDHLRSKEK